MINIKAKINQNEAKMSLQRINEISSSEKISNIDKNLKQLKRGKKTQINKIRSEKVVIKQILFLINKHNYFLF